MTRLVIDAGVVVKWFSSKNESDVEIAYDVYRDARKGLIELHGPDLLFSEVMNILARKKRLDKKELSGVQSILLSEVFIYHRVGDWIDKAYVHRLVEEKLTAYDAMYVQLAETLTCPLLTVGGVLAEAYHGAVGLRDI